MAVIFRAGEFKAAQIVIPGGQRLNSTVCLPAGVHRGDIQGQRFTVGIEKMTNYLSCCVPAVDVYHYSLAHYHLNRLSLIHHLGLAAARLARRFSPPLSLSVLKMLEPLSVHEQVGLTFACPHQTDVHPVLGWAVAHVHVNNFLAGAVRDQHTRNLPVTSHAHIFIAHMSRTVSHYYIVLVLQIGH